MQVRGGDAAGGADEADLLAPLDRVADGDLGKAHVEVAGHDAVAVIDVHDVAGEKEAVDERDHPAIRGVDRIAGRAAIVDAEVAAGDAAVEHPPGAEAARDPRLARSLEWARPQLRRFLRAVAEGRASSFSRSMRASVAESSRRVNLRVHVQAARSRRPPASLACWRGLVRILERQSEAVDRARLMLDNHPGDDGIRRVDRDRAERLQRPPSSGRKWSGSPAIEPVTRTIESPWPGSRSIVNRVRDPVAGCRGSTTRRGCCAADGARNRNRNQGSECPSHSLMHGTKIHRSPVGPATAYPSAGTKIRWM